MKAIVFDNYKEKFNKINEYLQIQTVDFEIIKFRNGEGKVVVKEDVSNEDVIVFSDFYNSTSYEYLSKKRKYSKDEYYVELKRVLSALDCAKSISVFLPLMYQSRQNSTNKLESKDYLLFVEDLKHNNVKNIITFEAHGDHKDVISYSFAKLFKDAKYDAVVSPDAGGVKRSEEYSKVLNCENCHFAKTRDLNHIVDGLNPIQSYSNCDYDFKDKKVLIVDDILDSGSTLINALNNIEDAKSIDVFVTYPLFSSGVKKFIKMVKDKKLNKLYISDLIYFDKRILKNKFIKVIDTDKFLSEVIKEVIK